MVAETWQATVRAAKPVPGDISSSSSRTSTVASSLHHKSTSRRAATQDAGHGEDARRTHGKRHVDDIEMGSCRLR